MLQFNPLLLNPDIFDFSLTRTKKGNPDEWEGSGKMFVMDEHGTIMDKTALDDINRRTLEYKHELEEIEKNAKPLTDDDIDFLKEFEASHCKSTLED